MQEEINEVLRLIAHPLNNARKLLKGENKLVIQSNLLHRFNTVLDIVENKPSDIIIYHADRKTLESFEKLLSKIPKLVVTQRSIHSHNHFVDIRRFKKLRHLELIRVPLDKVKGLNVLKPQLEYFLCDHCSEVEIITKSGKLQWSELVTLKLKNSSVNIDEHFFVSMPWIQHLDLSFTNLRKLDALQCLDNLKYLNISFNHLEVLPTLSSAACPQLQILLISHNYLQSLQGLEYLTSLRGLDLSWNWISDKCTLAPLLNLKSLQWINLSNTPVSFSKYYRIYLASAIGSNAAPHQFVIDNKGLNRQEQGVMGSGLGIVRCGKGSYGSGDVQFHEAISPNPHHVSSAHSINKASVSSSTKSKIPSRKGNKVREVVIEDLTENNANDTVKLIKTEAQAPKLLEGLENQGCIVQERQEESIQNGAEQQNVINNIIHEAVFSQQFVPEEKSENDIENKIPDQTATINNITLGILEVEIHDSRYSENKEDDSGNGEDSAESSIEEKTKISEQLMPATDHLHDTWAHSHENDDNANLQLSAGQHISEISLPTSDEFIQAEILQDSASLKTIDTNIESDHKNDSVQNFDQSEEINSSAESHQDDQDYFSATEDKDRTKTLSSIDSGDLDESHETLAFVESHQDDLQTSVLVAEETYAKNESVTSTDTAVSLVPNPSDTQEKEVTKMDVDRDSESESSGASDSTEDEMWHVQKVDKTGVQNILLVLLDNEIKERSPISGRILTSWTLDCVQSCVKTKNEPFTVELEFDSVKPDKQKRTYIMEFSDAQVLIKRMYSILESRPLSAMNQSTFKCLKCDSIFVHSTPTSSKLNASQVRCTICSSLMVSLMEEPRLPEVKPLPDKPVSHSSSQSSIALDRVKDGNGSSTASSTSKISCSAASLEHAQKLGSVNTGMATPRKYESDIEIISNPSQSSVEVLDEYGRSQGSTPCRKRSSEERQIVAVPQLGTVLEVNAQLSALTESSSSGSLTESVITTYESHNLINKKPKPEECLIEESREGSPVTELATSKTQGTLSEENGNISQIKPSSTDIYNYNDFTQVDVRIKLFLYQSIFNDENEELLLLAKCHLWKTGGADYDGCVVFSTTKVYFLSHSYTKFQEDTCDWLTLTDTFLLKEIKKIYPIIWHQGAILNTNKITYLILLLDKERTVNFFKFLEGLSLKEPKIQNYINTKNEMALQQVVLSSTVPHDSVDPSISSFSICLKICITKDDDEEIMRLPGLVITGSEFHVVPGDLKWLCSNITPTIHLSQQIASLIEVERTETSLKFHFLDEEEALEEIWSIKLATSDQVSLVIASIKTAWEDIFLAPLEVAYK